MIFEFSKHLVIIGSLQIISSYIITIDWLPYQSPLIIFLKS